MPPRYAYWTIIAGGLPTAFRAAEEADLIPTFKRIKEKHPDAQMKWFARGKLWSSPDEVRAPLDARDRPGSRRERRAEPSPEEARGPKPARYGDRNHDRRGSFTDQRGAQDAAPATDAGTRRGRDWRPGGEHRDPRQKFKDAKKAKNQEHRQQRWEHKNKRAETRGVPRPDAERAPNMPAPPRPRPDADRPRDEGYGGKRPFTPSGAKPAYSARPSGSRDFKGGFKGHDRPAPFNRDRGGFKGTDRPAPYGSDRGGFKGKDSRPPFNRDRGGFKGGDRPAPYGSDRGGFKGKDSRPPFNRDRGSFTDTPRDRPAPRPFARNDRDRPRGSQNPPATPSRREPTDEPPPRQEPSPDRPPRPTEPIIPPPGPPERGRRRRS